MIALGNIADGSRASVEGSCQVFQSPANAVASAFTAEIEAYNPLSNVSLHFSPHPRLLTHSALDHLTKK